MLHTLLGPDHYLPFVVLSRARNWSLLQTLTVTGICGIGHVLGSVVLGMIGLLFGYALSQFEAWEFARGDAAAWALVVFGLTYGIFGIRHAVRTKKGLDLHTHGHHVHVHSQGNTPHRHAGFPMHSKTTFWALLISFVLGPCEPLIPLFFAPASRGDWQIAFFTALIFGVATVSAMLFSTSVMVLGLGRLALSGLERWMHAMAGGVIALCGVSMLTLGL